MSHRLICFFIVKNKKIKWERKLLLMFLLESEFEADGYVFAP